jgi:hypothetical protein
MKNLYILLLLFFSVINPLTLDAQKTYKAVCDKSDGKVKIVESEDRSPDLVPLKGGFPFFQVAENWIKENYPDGNCDPARAASQNQAAANAMVQAAAPTQNQPAQNEPAHTQTKQNASPNNLFNAPASRTAAAMPAFRYRNTSMFISFLFSNMGIVYNIDPPLIPGVGIGIDQVFGTKFYGGTGLHLNTLIGKTDDGAGVSSFYSVRIPLFAGYRHMTGTRYWGVDMGVAANTMLRPLTSDSYLAGEIAADYSANVMTRLRMGKERTTFELGVDAWINDILSSEEGFQMIVLFLGYRLAF